MGVGDYFIDCLTSDIASLKFFAGIHPIYFGLYKINSKRFPFAVYYDVKEIFVRVGAVIDMRKEPGTIVARLKQL